MIEKKNLFDETPRSLPSEMVETLAQGTGDFKIERIVSRGHRSGADFRYNQETVEWVALLQGTAQLRFFDPDQTIELQSGDWIEIPAHRKHRVESTSPDGDTVWLAIHWNENPA